jgi:hypothetical protein
MVCHRFGQSFFSRDYVGIRQRKKLDMLVNAGASAKLVEKTIDYTEAITAYFKALLWRAPSQNESPSSSAYLCLGSTG